jgi:hypothetical protein
MIGVPRAVTLEKRSNHRFFPSFARFYAEAARWRKCETPAFHKGLCKPRKKYIISDVYLILPRIAPPSQKSGTKLHPKNHPTDRVLMPTAGDAFPIAFPWPFKVVATGPEPAYRGGRTITANPCFEGRI